MTELIIWIVVISLVIILIVVIAIIILRKRNEDDELTGLDEDEYESEGLETPSMSKEAKY